MNNRHLAEQRLRHPFHMFQQLRADHCVHQTLLYRQRAYDHHTNVVHCVYRQCVVWSSSGERAMYACTYQVRLIPPQFPPLLSYGVFCRGNPG
jgi:hypothetical protein